MNEEIDNSPDEKLTEAEALKQAEANGISFRDEFSVIKVSDLTVVSDIFETKEEAQKELASKYKNSEEYTVQQTRRQA